MEDGMYPRFFDRIRRKPLVETNGCDAHASLTSGLASQHESRKEPRKTSEAAAIHGSGGGGAAAASCARSIHVMKAC